MRMATQRRDSDKLAETFDIYKRCIKTQNLLEGNPVIGKSSYSKS